MAGSAAATAPALGGAAVAGAALLTAAVEGAAGVATTCNSLRKGADPEGSLALAEAATAIGGGNAERSLGHRSGCSEQAPRADVASATPMARASGDGSP